MTLSHTSSSRSESRAFPWVALLLGALALAATMDAYWGDPAHAVGRHGGEPEAVPSLFAVIPFVGILLSIAFMPLSPLTREWWHSNRNKLAVSICFAGFTLLYYGGIYGVEKVVGVVEHAIAGEYVPFIILLFALYVISGGICLKGDLPPHPGTNTLFLGTGAALASLVGTTGASMLLIRPLLQINSERRYVAHTVIFFIFLVSNVGGCLLPIGDPPLFLGYLRGVPFLWTLNLWLPWLTTSGLLLGVYFFWDTLAYRKETIRDVARNEGRKQPLSLRGSINFLWLIGVVLCVALIKPGVPLFEGGPTVPHFAREAMMLFLVAASLIVTPARVRRDNRFNFEAILEVAALFIGIFICMQAPIEILRGSGEALSRILSQPWHFFWGAGSLSSFLDNAPTYVVFFETAETMTGGDATHSLRLVDGRLIHENWLRAVSLGTVFMGAMTYIGNGPNFMVKSIAEESGVKMPSFFGYMLYSVGLLIPIFILVSAFFL